MSRPPFAKIVQVVHAPQLAYTTDEGTSEMDGLIKLLEGQIIQVVPSNIGAQVTCWMLPLYYPETLLALKWWQDNIPLSPDGRCRCEGLEPRVIRQRTMSFRADNYTYTGCYPAGTPVLTLNRDDNWKGIVFNYEQQSAKSMRKVYTPWLAAGTPTRPIT